MRALRSPPPEGRAKRARIYIIDEAPGEAEAEAGNPAGQTLRRMMRATGIDPSQVRLGNAIPYRPIATGKGGTRRSWTPTRAEIDRSSGQLLQDVERSEPGAILALGRSAMAAFGIRSSIEQARGRAFRRAGMPLLATYHPQYVAYRGGEHGLVWRTMVCDLARAWRASTPSASKDRPGR